MYNRTAKEEVFGTQTGGNYRKEGEGYVALCPETDIARQGNTIEQARDNLREVLELFFEAASPEGIRNRLHGDGFETEVGLQLGKLRVLSGRELCALLARHGFTEVRRRGSHIPRSEFE